METRRRLHSSIESHWSTELALLQALKHRSKDQHGNQIFYRRISEILRLGKRVQALIPGIREQSVSEQVARDLLHKFVSALVKAVNSTEQIIELRHFLPLQISLLGIYSRLFTIVNNIAMCIGIDTQGLLARRRITTARPALQGISLETDLDLGQLIKRGTSSEARVVSPAKGYDGQSLEVPHDEPDGPEPLEDEPTVITLRKRRKDNPSKSKKKRNVMDDIFG